MAETSDPKSLDQKLFPLVWAVVAFKTLLPWLVFFRLTFEGSSYQWGTSLFGKMFYSAGLSRPDFLLIYGLLTAGVFLLYQLRKFNVGIVGPALLVYFGFFAADALYNLALGEPLIFQGDTLGVRVNISIPFFVLHFAALLLVIGWWWSARRSGGAATTPGLAPARKVVALACLCFVPVQLVLLISGEPHGTTDAIGVIGTLLQWVLLSWAMYPGTGKRRADPRAFPTPSISV